MTLLAHRCMLSLGELRCIYAAVECYRRRQTPASVTSLARYTMCSRASNKCQHRYYRKTLLCLIYLDLYEKVQVF